MAALIRLLAIAAMILMPISMGTASAVAAPVPTQTSVEGGNEGHCGQQNGSEPDGSPAMQCAGTCSAFPAEPAALPLQKLAPATSHSGDPVKVLHGVKLTLSTPPPRLG